MKRILFLFVCSFVLSHVAFAQGMSDQQMMQFIAAEAKAGTNQAQIVTKLMQRGVKVEQIQRLRKQYDAKVKNSSMGAAADAAVSDAENRMRKQNAATKRTIGMTEYANADMAGNGIDDISAADVSMPAMRDSINNLFHGKKVFGRDIFNNKNLNFEPNMNLATPQNYVLGPGDKVYVDIYGASQKTEELIVSPDGDITVPGFGPIQVSGLSVAAAQSRIRGTLGSRYASSNLKLTVGQTRTIQVNVMGEVMAPGSYTLSAFATVFHALYMAGGTNSIGTLRNIKVYRQGKLVSTVDVYQYILSGRLAGNIRLQDNDVVQVGPYDCIVDIAGNVKRPMAFEMRKNESVKTLLDYAGGFSANAYKEQIRLIRRSGRLKTVYNIKEFDMNGFKVADGDSLSVDSMLDRYENMVEVRGAVFRSGMYRLGEEVTSVKSLIEAADGLMEDAFTSRGVMYRMKEDRTLEAQSIDIAGIMAGTVADIPLKNEDVLFIPTQTDRVSERTVTINGEVFSPGTFVFADNETIEDLIIRAGGLTDAASLAKVDVSRRIVDPNATSKSDEIAKTFSFSLKDGLVIEGDRNFVLEPYDVVSVRRSPAFSTARTIRVDGEVNFEGDFTLENKHMHLSDAIKMAGGATDAAYLRGARLVRLMNDEERVRQQATLEAIRNLLTERGDSVSSEKLQLGDTYVVGIELDKAMKNPGGEYDILLREGDRIFVPEFNGSIKISGDVFFPNTVSYVAGKGYKYYVNQAGGWGNRAKKSKTFIVYQNGTIGVASKGAKPEPGCEIVVPSKKQRNPVNWASFISMGTSLASLATMVVALTKL